MVGIFGLLKIMQLNGYDEYREFLYNFFIENINSIFNISLSYVKITLPLGISFYTFQTMSYTIDVFLKKVKPEKNIIDFGAFVCLFPQLIAGPIVKYTDINRELKSRKVNLDAIQERKRLFILGLSSKVIIANNIGSLWTDVEVMGFSYISTILAWMGIIAFALQIYFDFSGYSLMAIGLGKIFGFDFCENFNYPYISGSITEFWRRWHISLGSWFRDYVYIPLGGNRVSKPRWIFNIFVVWFLTGRWHGAAWNFVFWGLFYAVLLMAEKFFLLPALKKGRALPHVYVLLAVTLGFVLFDAASLKDALHQLGTLIGSGTASGLGTEALYMLRSYGVVLALAVLGATPLPAMLWKKAQEAKSLAPVLTVAEPLCTLALLALCTAFLVDGSFNPFLYFRF